jgi:hypothetical protein
MPFARRAYDNRRSRSEQILIVLTSLETSTRPEAISYQQQAIYLHQVHQRSRPESEVYYLHERTSVVKSVSVKSVPDS